MSRAVPRWSALPSLMPLLLPQALHNVVSVNPFPVKGEGGVYWLTPASSIAPEDARAYVCFYARSRNGTDSACLLDLGLDRVLGGFRGHLRVFLFATQVFFPQWLADNKLLQSIRMVGDRLGNVELAANQRYPALCRQPIRLVFSPLVVDRLVGRHLAGVRRWRTRDGVLPDFVAIGQSLQV